MSQLKKATQEQQVPRRNHLVRANSTKQSQQPALQLDLEYLPAFHQFKHPPNTKQHCNKNTQNVNAIQEGNKHKETLVRKYSYQNKKQKAQILMYQMNNSTEPRISKIPASITINNYQEKLQKSTTQPFQQKEGDQKEYNKQYSDQKQSKNIVLPAETPRQKCQNNNQTPTVQNQQKQPLTQENNNQKYLINKQANTIIDKYDEPTPSKYDQMSDPETHIYDIPKFQQMMLSLLQQPQLKTNTKRMIQKQLDAFWSQQQNMVETKTPTEHASKQNNFKEPSLQDFTQIKKLGKGMFGEVFLVGHKLTGFICALKIVNKEVIRVQKVETQFIQELKLHSYLHHPNIVEIYGCFSDEENIYILEQLCTGGQLFDLLIKRRRISQKRTAYYMKQLVQGLRYIHTMDITHRDIKPQNILIESGVIKICDFGWAVHSIDNQHKGKCGTPLYLSPQVVQDLTYSEKVDVWGVALITYQLLVGNIPWNIWTEEETEKIVNDEVTFPEYLPLSEIAKEFIKKGLVKDPEQRITLLETFTDPFLIGVNPMEYQDETFDGYGEATP